MDLLQSLTRQVKTMLRFQIVQSDTDAMTSHSGLALVGRAIAHTRLDKDIDTTPLRHGIAHADCVRSYVGLLCTGKSDFDVIENKRRDTFFTTALGIAKVPSAPSLRQRFDEHASAMIPHVDNASTAFGAARAIAARTECGGRQSLPPHDLLLL